MMSFAKVLGGLHCLNRPNTMLYFLTVISRFTFISHSLQIVCKFVKNYLDFIEQFHTLNISFKLKDASCLIHTLAYF